MRMLSSKQPKENPHAKNPSKAYQSPGIGAISLSLLVHRRNDRSTCPCEEWVTRQFKRAGFVPYDEFCAVPAKGRP